jgi:putative ABC transport system ATP-binding protein
MLLPIRAGSNGKASCLIPQHAGPGRQPTLGLSMRTVQRRVRAPMERVAAETRLQLGFQAAPPRLNLTLRVEPGASPYRYRLKSRRLGEDINRSFGGTADQPGRAIGMAGQLISVAGHLSGQTSVVRADDVVRVYGEGDTAVRALRGVSVEIESGQLTAVMGPSGSGKSTLMHILAGLDKPTSGSVRIDGTEITTLGDNDLTRLRRKHIGFIFQFFNLLPMLTARDNVLLPMTIAGERPDPDYFDELIERVGLGDRLSHRPAELSGGQQQRVAIARALVSRPTVIFADEPTGNLDSKTSGEILQLMRGSVDEYGQTTVMVTHDGRAAAMADRVLFLADGEIVKETGQTSQHEILQIIDTLDLQ